MTSPLLRGTKCDPLFYMSKKSIDNILYVLFGLLLLLGVFLIYKFYTLKERKQAEFYRNNPPIARPLPTAIAPGKRPQIQRKTTFRPKIKQTKTHFKQTKKRIEAQSKVAKNRFESLAHINLKWPQDLNYLEIDLDDNMLVVYGYNHESNTGLTAAARPKTTSMEEVMLYLKTEKDDIPNLDGRKIQNYSNPVNIPFANMKPGIESIEVMQADLDDGSKANFGIINRKDKKGSYIFVYTAPQSQLENDGYFDAIFDSMQVLEESTKAKHKRK